MPRSNRMMSSGPSVGPIKSTESLILLRSSFGSKKLNYILKCSPCLGHPALSILDDLLRQGLESIVNCSLNNHQWLQAALPIKNGGLVIRRVVSLASSAYLASDCKHPFWQSEQHHRMIMWRRLWKSANTHCRRQNCFPPNKARGTGL